MFKKTISLMAAGCGALMLCSCLGTTEDSELRTVYVDRASVEKLADDEITSLSVDMDQMKKEKKLGIVVELNFDCGTLPEDFRRNSGFDEVAFAKAAYEMAQTYLHNTKAYKLFIIDAKDKNADKLKSSDEIDGAKISFRARITAIPSTEIFERFDEDEQMYKITFDWKLIDNRTKANGLSKTQETPTVKEALVCEAHTYRKNKVSSISNRRMSGASVKNMTGAFLDSFGNCLIQFYAQLSNRIPYGGMISAIRLVDGKIKMTLKSGPEEGIKKNMQMLIISEEGDQIAVATATGGADPKKTPLTVWRWLSPSMKKSIMGVAGDKKKAEEWLDEEGHKLYAVCLGTPKPSKDEIKKYTHR